MVVILPGVVDVSIVVVLVDVFETLVGVVEVSSESETSFSGGLIPSAFWSTAGLLVSLTTTLLVDMLTDAVLVVCVGLIVSVVIVVSAVVPGVVVEVDVFVEFCNNLAGNVAKFEISSEAVVWNIQSGAVVSSTKGRGLVLKSSKSNSGVVAVDNKSSRKSSVVAKSGNTRSESVVTNGRPSVDVG